MLRCRRLSTVCGLDRHSPRLPSFFTAQTTSRFSVLTVDLTRGLDTSAGPSSTEQHDSARTQDVVHLSSGSSRRCLEHPDQCGTGHHRNGHSVIDALRRYLSSENVASVDPFIYSPTAVRSLYYRAESRGQLGMLDSGMLTRLIGIFGTLSVDSRASIPYRAPLSSRPSEVSAQRTHWSFILKVGKYKVDRGLPLHDSDRFWLMRAELALARVNSPLELDAYHALLRARMHYHIIRRHSRHPEVHSHFLEALLAVRDPRLLDFAARDLSFLLRTQHVCRPWLQRLLCLLVTKHGSSLPTRCQETVLAALWSRAHPETDGDPVPKYPQTDIVVGYCKSDATTVARSLSSNLFGIVSCPSLDGSANLYKYLSSAFSPEHALPSRWNALMSFCVFNSSQSLLDGTYCTDDHTAPLATSCWQVIFRLATVDRIFQRPSSSLAIEPTSKDSVMGAMRNLCQRWLPIAQSGLVSPNIVCAIATSFLRTANILLDAGLFHDCQSLYSMVNSLGGLPIWVKGQLTAQYAATAVRIQGALPGVVVPILDTFSLDLELRRQVITSAVETLAPLDALLAHALYTVAKENGVEPDSSTTYSLAMSLAQSGALRQTTDFLNYSGFSLEKKGMLVAAIARNLRDNPRTRQPLDVYVAIVDALAALYHSHAPPEHFRGHLEQLIIILARHGRHNQLFPVVASIFRRSPNFFQRGFFDRYCRVLARRRQLAIVTKLVDTITAIHPEIARSLPIFAGRFELRTKISRIFPRNSPLRGPASLRLSSRLRHRPYSGPPLEHSLQELLRSGRVLAAKRIFTCTAPTLPSKRFVTLGNILLHGLSRQPALRNGRRVRKVFALLENLVQDHNFQPNRVTVNILARVLIEWRSAFDSPRLRELFDQLVRGGCPAAEYSALHPPFGTRQTLSLGTAGFPKLPSFVSFEKHAKPLLKMFINAFYLRNDVEAARKVVGILKVEEYKSMVAEEARRSARSRGRAKATPRNVNTETTLCD